MVQFIMWEKVTVCRDLQVVNDSLQWYNIFLTSLAYKSQPHLHERALPLSATPPEVVGQEVLKGAVMLLEVVSKQLFSLVCYWWIFKSHKGIRISGLEKQILASLKDLNVCVYVHGVWHVHGNADNHLYYVNCSGCYNCSIVYWKSLCPTLHFWQASHNAQSQHWVWPCKWAALCWQELCQWTVVWNIVINPSN